MVWRLFLILELLTPQTALASASCAPLWNGVATLGHEQATCGTSRLLGGHTQTTCYWTFAYRADTAQTQFDHMQAQIEACLGPDAALPADMAVNHPDSFALNQYVGQRLHVSLSLKDKAGRNQTLIFLSLHPVP